MIGFLLPFFHGGISCSIVAKKEENWRVARKERRYIPTGQSEEKIQHIVIWNRFATSLESKSWHHSHATAKASFKPKQKFGQRNGRSSCAHSIGKFFLCYMVLFSFETSATGSPGNYLYTWLQCYEFKNKPNCQVRLWWTLDIDIEKTLCTVPEATTVQSTVDKVLGKTISFSPYPTCENNRMTFNKLPNLTSKTLYI